MRTENIYSVYVHKNLKNDKYYVGMTSQEPKERWDSGWGYYSNPQMWKDIQESNWNTDWCHGILGKFTDKNEALKYESFLIAMLGSVNNGYNISEYDSHYYKRSEDTRNKMSQARIGEKAYWFGKHFTEEHKKKLSDSKPKNPVLQFSKTGEFISEYSSTMEAERHTGCHHAHISKCCKGKLKSCGGFIWKYKEG